MAKRRTSNWIKFVIALLCLPLCIGIFNSFLRIIQATGNADSIWVALLAGASCWLVIYLLLPKPMLIYVFGHELTHAIWTWMCGGKVKRMKVTSKGGHVVVTKSNFLIDLAPYFFPLYAFIVTIIFAVGHLLWGWKTFSVWFHLLLGISYAFHLTLTWHILQVRQSDIVQHGRFFSGVVIFMGNVLTMLLGISVLTGRVNPLTALGWCWIETGRVWLRITEIF